jgi:hypothetical protein
MKKHAMQLSTGLFFCSLTVLWVMFAAIETGAATPATNQPPAKVTDTSGHQGYRIDQPGTITFTVGMVIKGKIEKPQVMIFLPKEKSFYRELKLTHSFADELNAPLPFSPVVE